MSTITVLPDPEALAQHAAQWLTEQAEAAVAGPAGRFSVALSGGSTPKRLYQILAADPWRDRFPWARTHLFWGDERLVPHDHADSNYHMTREALLSKAPVPAANVHPMPVDGTPAEAAARYQRTLADYYGHDELHAALPLLDVVLLGLGENGHTLSLFPDTPSLDEDRAWVTPVTTGVPQPRLTLTYPAVANSGLAVFLVAGASKRDVLALVRGGDRDQPATRITAIRGVRFFADAAAAP